MAFPTSPGVFMQDRSRPPEWQGKGVMLFVGPLPKGPVGHPVLVKNTTELEDLFGEADASASSRHVTFVALKAFFDQGGRTALILRLAVGGLQADDADLQMVVTAEGTPELIECCGPDSIQPDHPNWVSAIEAAFRAFADPNPLCDLTAGRVEMLAAPAVASMPPKVAAEIYRVLHDICCAKDMFLLIDPPLNAPAGGFKAGWFDRFGLEDSTNAVALFPFLRSQDGQGDLMPPSGAVVGMLDRIASRGGIWSVPTGGQACLNGLIPDELTEQITSSEINQIHKTSGGARFAEDGIFTLAGKSSPRLRHLRVMRKTRLTLQRELDRLVVETDPSGRRGEARLIAEALMMQLWQDGALFGRTPAQAFRITTTNPDLATGAFELCVGLALLEPGKFLWQSLTVN